MELTDNNINWLKEDFGKIITPFASLNDFKEYLLATFLELAGCLLTLPIAALLGVGSLILTVFLFAPLLICCGDGEGAKEAFFAASDVACGAFLLILILAIQPIIFVTRTFSTLFDLGCSFFLNNPHDEPHPEPENLEVNNPRGAPLPEPRNQQINNHHAEPRPQQRNAFFAPGAEPPIVHERSDIEMELEKHNINLEELEKYCEDHYEEPEINNFTCNLSFRICTDPVLIKDEGHSYKFDKKSIVEWWKHKPFHNPVTGLQFHNVKMEKDVAKENKIKELIRECAKKPDGSINLDDEHKSDIPRPG